MKLNYRGVSYEYNPPTFATVESEVGGKYRGLDWRFRNLKKSPVLQPPVNLTYRGVAYSNHAPAAPQAASSSVSQKARWLMLNREKAARNRTASMLERSSEEIGLA